MTRSALFLTIAAVTLTGCVGVRDHRGYVADTELMQGIQPGIDNRDSVMKTLGTPTFVGQFGNSDWYYLGRDTKTFAFRNPRVLDQSLLHIRFDAAGNVAAVDRTGREQIASVRPMRGATPTLGRKRSFFDELLGNIGSIAQPGLPGAGNNPNQ